MTSHSDITTMTDEQLVEETHRLARAMSYFNAAEGNWSQETSDRNACRTDLRQALTEMDQRGLRFEDKGYLL